MIQYEKHPLNPDEVSKIRSILLGREMQQLSRCLQCERDAHYLTAMNLRTEAIIDGPSEKWTLEAEGEEAKARELAKFIQTLDKLTAGGYQFFTIKVNS